MSIRTGIAVGVSTECSSVSDQIKHYKARELPLPKPKWNKYEAYRRSKEAPNNSSHESLALKCVKQLVDHFEQLPASADNVPHQYIREITSRLPTNLDPKIAALYVFDENYWKRRCVEQLGWAKCNITRHCLIWKQVFYESYIQRRLETFDKDIEIIEHLLEEVRTYADYVFTLQFSQLPSHLDLSQVCACLPNLSKLVAAYGVKNIGMKYERILFGMKISDASSLARTFLTCAPNLSSLVLSRNLVDDDLLRMLMTGLMKNSSVTALDLSHNRITNHGARLLSRMLLEKTVLISLNLADNMIHAEGGRYLARGLRTNDSLVELDLRLNRLTDLGGRLLLDGILDNRNVTRLNLSSNSLGGESMNALSALLKSRSCPVQVLDISCNDFEEEHLQALRQAVEGNNQLISIDVRRNKFLQEACENVLKGIQEITHANELRQRSTFSSLEDAQDDHRHESRLCR